MSQSPNCQARSRARVDPLPEPYQLPPGEGLGGHLEKKQDWLEHPGSPGERKAPCSHRWLCGHPQPYPSWCLGLGEVGVISILRQWLWALLLMLMPQGMCSYSQTKASSEANCGKCCTWSMGGGAQSREPGAEVPSHSLPPGKGLSLHFPQTLALPLNSLLIPFPCCPALGPTTP